METEPYIVGRYYRVPCIEWQRHREGLWEWVPILGPLHEDAEHIGFPHEHWHIDWRFVGVAFLRSFKSRPPHAQVIVLDPKEWTCTRGALTLLKKRCKREMPCIRKAASFIPWLKALEAAYAGCRLKPGMICPHKGMPLAGHPVKDGVVVCSAHGLAWDVATGELVTSDGLPAKHANDAKIVTD